MQQKLLFSLSVLPCEPECDFTTVRFLNPKNTMKICLVLSIFKTTQADVHPTKVTIIFVCASL